MYKLLIVLSTFASVSLAANDDYTLIEQGLNSYASKVHQLRQNIDNSVFDDQEILLKLDFDTDQLISFAQDKIAFQPYSGLLRGVQGTLNARAGNALDQSALLAKLLNDAGLEARVAKGELSDPMALQLLSGMAQANIPDHIGQGIEFENALKAFKLKDSGKIDWHKTQTYARYKKSHDILSQILEQNDIALQPKDITDQLIQQSKQYFWVQYRSNPTDTWHDAHPAFNPDSKQPANLTPKVTEHFQGSVPKKYLHQLKIEAFIEQRIGTKVKQHSLMKPWIKPVANLQDQLITFSNAPSGVSYDTDYELTEILDKSSFFAPTFNGHKVGGRVFDLKGRLVDAEAASAPAGAVFKTLGDKTISAVDKLSGMDRNEPQSQPLMQLNSQWLQFTFIYPDGTEFVQKRYIYQAANTKTIEDKIVKTQLMTEYALLVNSGEKPNAYVAKVYLDLVESGLPLLKSSAKKVFNPNQKVGFPKQINRNEFELLTQYYWMQQNPVINNDVIQYRPQASLLGFKRGYVNPETAFLAVDIIANNQQFIIKKSDNFYTDPQSAIRQGIWETASEWVPSRIMALSGNSIDTLKVTQASSAQNIDFAVFQPNPKGTAELKQDFTENPALLNQILADLIQGYVIVTPSRTPKNLIMTGWWRVNPDTGETLGMIANGGGSELTEYLTDMTNNALTLVRAVGNLKKCNAKTNDLEKLCCLAEAHFNNVGGLAFGGALGGVVGTAGSALFSIADFTTELVTEGIAGSGNGTGITPSTNGQLCAGMDFPDF